MLLFRILFTVSIDWLKFNWILKFKHLDFKVGKIFLLLLIKIKLILSLGSSRILSRAFTEFIFNNSILSINTILGLSLKEDLLSDKIKFLIWSISIFFLSAETSINIKFGFDLFWTNLNDLFSEFIWRFLVS